MYSRLEASQLKKKFWTSFGQYMRPIPNVDGETINWINYKTGVRNIHFRMDADNHNASIAIELRHTDPVLRENYFNKFLALKPMITEILGEHWEWQPAVKDEDEKLISRIGIVIKGVNVFDAGDWPTIISFLKPRMLALDQAWSLVKDNFI